MDQNPSQPRSFERSHGLFERACTVIPGGVNSPVRAFKAVGGEPLFIERGEGAYLFDADGMHFEDDCVPGEHGRGGWA